MCHSSIATAAIDPRRPRGLEMLLLCYAKPSTRSSSSSIQQGAGHCCCPQLQVRGCGKRRTLDRRQTASEATTTELGHDAHAHTLTHSLYPCRVPAECTVSRLRSSRRATARCCRGRTSTSTSHSRSTNANFSSLGCSRQPRSSKPATAAATAAPIEYRSRSAASKPTAAAGTVRTAAYASAARK